VQEVLSLPLSMILIIDFESFLTLWYVFLHCIPLL
jgi:hypothetical protein